MAPITVPPKAIKTVMPKVHGLKPYAKVSEWVVPEITAVSKAKQQSTQRPNDSRFEQIRVELHHSLVVSSSRLDTERRMRTVLIS
jgi:cell division septal protein FtsQ